MPVLSKDLFPDLGMPDKVYGYEIRNPYESEVQYFYENPNVSGMAAEDGRIILNPYSSLSSDEMGRVAQNEAVRLFLREYNVNPNFTLTEEQEKEFKNYSQNPVDIQHTILARIISQDPSAGKTTKEQQIWADWMEQALNQQYFNPEGDQYDYRTALSNGMQPDKETMHWSSREPNTGQILKGRGHKTFYMTEQGEKDAGYEIYRGPDGRYYSRKKQ